MKSDPDGTGSLSYSWRTSNDRTTWEEISQESTYLTSSADEGKSIKAVISYKDGEGFNEVVSTSTSNIPFANGKPPFEIIYEFPNIQKDDSFSEYSSKGIRPFL